MTVIFLWFGACVVEGYECDAFFRIHRLQDDLRGPNRVKRDVDDGVRTLIRVLKVLKEKQVSVKSGTGIRQSDLLRNPPVE